MEPSRTCLGHRYELRGVLATGGMGQVWRAQDLLLGRPVAVKVLRSEYTADPLFRARFRAEAQHAAALNHPHIARVFDYGEEAVADGSGELLAYLVMELVEGESLSALLSRDGPLTPDQTLRVLGQTSAALAVAHAAGVVHRDVKPGNVLVSRDGDVKITDFGIAWSAGSVPLTQTGQVVGTAAYLSPEQAAGSHATPASDVYSLGMVGYECLTGRKAFEGENSVAVALQQLRDQPAPLPDEVPAGVRALIEHAMVKDPASRWRDGAAFAAAVDDVVAGRELPPVVHSDTVSLWLAGPPAPEAAGTSTGTAERAVLSPPAPPRQQRVNRVLVPLVALLVGAGVAAAVLQQLDPGRPEGAARAPITGPASPVAAGEVLVAAGDYLGRPVAEVSAELTARGLLVDTRPLPTSDVDGGLVVSVSPAGSRLSTGDEVLVTYAVPLGDDGAADPVDRRAPIESVVQPSTAPPTATGPARTTEATTTPLAPTDSTTASTTSESPAGPSTSTTTDASSSASSSASSGSTSTPTPTVTPTRVIPPRRPTAPPTPTWTRPTGAPSTGTGDGGGDDAALQG